MRTGRAVKETEVCGISAYAEGERNPFPAKLAGRAIECEPACAITWLEVSDVEPPKRDSDAPGTDDDPVTELTPRTDGDLIRRAV